MLELVRAVLAIVIVFGVVIFVHEFGHFLAAKAVGVYAPRFSIGFGPALWSRKWGDTEYVLAAVPLGGYVRMASRDDETMARIEGGGEQPVAAPGEGSPRSRYWDPEAIAPFGPRPVPPERLFESKPLPARLLIMFAGVTMNVLLGFVILVVLSLTQGETIFPTRVVGGVHDVPGAPHLTRELVPGDTVLAVNGQPVRNWNAVDEALGGAESGTVTLRTQRGTVAIRVGGDSGVAPGALTYAIEPYFAPVVDEVLPGPAQRAGLEAGDSIAALAGTPVWSWAQVVDTIERSPGRTLAFTVVRQGAPVHLEIRPDSATQPDPVSGRSEVVGKIGARVRATTTHVAIPPARAVVLGAQLTWGTTTAIVANVRRLVTGQLSVRALAGPVAIGRASASAAQQGWVALLTLIAVLSINLAVFNLLPIPILDGGQIVMNVVESVKGSALSARTREYLLRLGLAAIALLFVIVMYNDITSWLKNLFRL